MEQQTGLKLEKEYVRAVYFHAAYLTSVQNTSSEMLGWINLCIEMMNNTLRITVISKPASRKIGLDKCI